MEISALYEIAQDENIPIIVLDIPKCKSMCLQSDDLACYIGVDKNIARNYADYRTHLAHELGHCCTGSFYNRWAKCDIRKKHENRADKWAIEKLVTKEELDRAIAAGCETVWQLSEYFGVTEDFMRKALCWYIHGNLAVDMYF